MGGIVSSYLKKVRPPSMVIQVRPREMMRMVDTVAFCVFFRALHFLDACFAVFRVNQSLSVSIDAYERRVAGFTST